MKCPCCGHTLSKVLNSRPVNENDSIKRRRQCERCNKRFTTYEKIESIPLMVIKKDCSREIYNREKLFKGILMACNKRNISINEITHLVDKIEFEIFEIESNEILTSTIGDIAMKHLREVDEVSYIRFASVYKRFVCIDEFVQELEKLKNNDN